MPNHDQMQSWLIVCPHTQVWQWEERKITEWEIPGRTLTNFWGQQNDWPHHARSIQVAAATPTHAAALHPPMLQSHTHRLQEGIPAFWNAIFLKTKIWYVNFRWTFICGRGFNPKDTWSPYLEGFAEMSEAEESARLCPQLKRMATYQKSFLMPPYDILSTHEVPENWLTWPAPCAGMCSPELPLVVLIFLFCVSCPKPLPPADWEALGLCTAL